MPPVVPAVVISDNTLCVLRHVYTVCVRGRLHRMVSASDNAVSIKARLYCTVCVRGRLHRMCTHAVCPAPTRHGVGERQRCTLRCRWHRRTSLVPPTDADPRRTLRSRRQPVDRPHVVHAGWTLDRSLPGVRRLLHHIGTMFAFIYLLLLLSVL